MLPSRPHRVLVAAALLGSVGILALTGAAPARNVGAGACEIEGAGPLKCPGSDFSGLDLRARLFVLAELSGSKFNNADLQDVNLWRADLRNSDFAGANMAGVFATGADLRGSDLRGVDLRQAFLYRAKADGSNFAGALLAGARWITGAVCGPGSVGDCKPLPPMADFVPRPLTWHLLSPVCEKRWRQANREPSAGKGSPFEAPANSGC
ncbi:MAG TPA: pentapeptide repeat-containing protein [Candidatus Acidoferrales bacterium]